MTKITKSTPTISLVSRHGRKYLTAEERRRFLKTARLARRPEVQTFALTLLLSGCRISEALALRAVHVDLEQALLHICNMKRETVSWREVPVPRELIRSLELVHRLRSLQARTATRRQHLWPISRSTASRQINEIMRTAEIRGPQACPQGIRHSFGVAAVNAGVPLTTLAAVLGHSSISTTAIYATAVESEVREQLRRMWQCLRNDD